MGPLQIPEVFVPGFVTLAELTPESFNGLAHRLEDSPLMDLSALAERVVADAADIEVLQAEQLVGALTSLFGYHRRAHEPIEGVAAGVGRSPALSTLSDAAREGLAHRVQRLLATRAISGAAKALDLQHHRHAVSSVHVVTETRFLFDDAEDLDPSAIYGAVLSHTLRIQTYDDDRDTIFMLTDEDLHDLRAELDRAAKKQAMIGERLRDDGFTLYGEFEESST